MNLAPPRPPRAARPIRDRSAAALPVAALLGAALLGAGASAGAQSRAPEAAVAVLLPAPSPTVAARQKRVRRSAAFAAPGTQIIPPWGPRPAIDAAPPPAMEGPLSLHIDLQNSGTPAPATAPAAEPPGMTEALPGDG